VDVTRDVPAPPPPPQRVRLPWPLALVPLAVALYCGGLALVAVPVGYDLTHWSDVVAMYRGERGQLMDPGDAAQARLAGWVFVVALGVVALAAMALTVPTLRGNGRARTLLGVTVSPAMLALFCLLTQAMGGHVDGGHDETFPMWLDAMEGLGLQVVFYPGVLAMVLLFLPPSNRYCAAKAAIRARRQAVTAGYGAH
jgi:hypothetical protein